MCFVSTTELDTRITFDSNIIFRTHDISLHEYGSEKKLDSPDFILECKVSDRYPMWLTQILSEMHLYKQNFSKYGNIYKTEIMPAIHAPLQAAEEAAYSKEDMQCLAQY